MYKGVSCFGLKLSQRSTQDITLEYHNGPRLIRSLWFTSNYKDKQPYYHEYQKSKEDRISGSACLKETTQPLMGYLFSRAEEARLAVVCGAHYSVIIAD